MHKCLHGDMGHVEPILLMCIKEVHGTASAYLKRVESQRATRSSADITLVCRRSRVKFGGRCFSSCGPRLWNALPKHTRKVESILAFKRLLKFWLFGEAFEGGRGGGGSALGRVTWILALYIRYYINCICKFRMIKRLEKCVAFQSVLIYVRGTVSCLPALLPNSSTAVYFIPGSAVNI
jgi:hypothetical protein